MERRYRQVNIVFLITTAVVLGAGFLPLGEIFPNYAMIFIVSQLIIFLPTLGYLFVTKQKYSEAVGIKKISPSNVILLIFFTFCMMSVMNLINAISMTFAKNVISGAVSDTATHNPFIVTMFCVAFIPAVFEESIYRGVFYHEYRKVNPLGAVLVSALLFGLLHGNLNQFSYAFCMGLIFALVVEATDSVLSTMIMHLIVNGSSVVLMYILPSLKEMAQGSDLLTEETVAVDFTLGSVLRTYGPIALVLGIGGFFLFRTIAQNCGRWEHIKGLFTRRGKEPIGRLFTIPLIITIVFWIVNMIALEVMPG